MLMIPRQTLEREGMMKAIVGAITKGTTEYSVGDLSIPGLRHFLFKSRPQVQVTAPKYEEPYEIIVLAYRIPSGSGCDACFRMHSSIAFISSVLHFAIVLRFDQT